MVSQLDLLHEFLASSQMPKRIALRDQYHLYIITLSDLLYCQSKNGYTVFFLKNGRQLTISRSIKEHEHLLPEMFFLRIHQSYIVNIDYLDCYSKEGYLILKDGTQLTLSTQKGIFLC